MALARLIVRGNADRPVAKRVLYALNHVQINARVLVKCIVMVPIVYNHSMNESPNTN